LVITHDLNVVGEICDRTVVMNDGETVESGPTERVLQTPEHPYTAKLLSCRLGTDENQAPPPAREAAADGGVRNDYPVTDRYRHAAVEREERPPVIEAIGLSKVFDLSDSLLDRLRNGRRRSKQSMRSTLRSIR
jgi:ATPase components of various ABC-type transport systems, contain duplicated ATPase